MDDVLDIDAMTPAQLADVLMERPVELPRFTDEELHAVAPRSPAWRLLPESTVVRMTEDERRAALRAAVRSLNARGYVRPAGQGAPSAALELRGALAFVHAAQTAPVSIAVAMRPDGRVTLLWGIEGGTRFLSEDVDQGVHRFTLRTAHITAAWLASELSGDAPADEGDGEVDGFDLASSDGDRLRAHLESGGSRAHVETAYAGGTDLRGHLTVVPFDGALLALSAAPLEDESMSEVRAVRVGRLGLARVLDGWLRPGWEMTG